MSVFTPSHKPTYLDACYRSLREQTDPDWEWVVVLNGGNRWRKPFPDPRVRVLIMDDLTGVGSAKRAAVAECRGDLLVELDHDDLLVETAIARLRAEAAAHPEAALIYSDTAQVDVDGKRDDSRFDEAHGWEYDDVDVTVAHETMSVLRCRSLPPTPHNVGLIWYAPNHVRAFPRWAYDAAGGYDESRYVLDDQDLMCRLYEQGPFHHVPEVLYLQRMHPGNTQREADTNARIQAETVSIYEQRIERLALAWCRRERLLPLDLGAAHGAQPGYLGVDLLPGDGVHMVGDVFEVLGGMRDDSVGLIRAHDFLEHIETRNKVRLLNELHRVLRHGGVLHTSTPSTDGRGAWQDPTHVSGWNSNSWWYFTDEQYAAFVPAITARFQCPVNRTWFPSAWHAEHHISYVTAILICDKGGPRQGGLRLGR